jgi:hypothetical protein
VLAGLKVTVIPTLNLAVKSPVEIIGRVRIEVPEAEPKEQEAHDTVVTEKLETVAPGPVPPPAASIVTLIVRPVHLEDPTEMQVTVICGEVGEAVPLVLTPPPGARNTAEPPVMVMALVGATTTVAEPAVAMTILPTPGPLGGLGETVIV